MPKVTPAYVEAAERLLAEENVSDVALEHTAAAAGRVYDRLFHALAPVIGAAGVQALFARSARLNKTAFPCLATALGNAEGPPTSWKTSERLVSCLGELEPHAAAKAAANLYATFLRLMTTFIGERLVTQILKSAFPKFDQIESKETE